MVLQSLWYLICCLILVQLTLVTAFPRNELISKGYKIGIAPSHVTESPNHLLKNTKSWSSVAGQINIYKYYGVQVDGVDWATPVNPKLLVDFAGNEKVALGCEFGDFHLSPNMAERIVQTAFQQLDPILQNGGMVDSLHLDGPIRRMLKGYQTHPDALSLEEIAAFMVKFWKQMKRKYPKIKIGLITNLPNWDYTKNLVGYNGHFTDKSGIYFLEALERVNRALISSGEQMAFLEVDCPFNYYRETRTRNKDAKVDNPAKLSHLQKWCKENEIQFNLVVNAEPRKEGAVGFYELTCKYLEHLEKDKIHPDTFFFQSWYKEPFAHLPENKKYTFMNTAKDAIALLVELYPRKSKASK